MMKVIGCGPTCKELAIECANSMNSIHRIEPVSQQPSTLMSHWNLRVIKRVDGHLSRHLVGRAQYEGRVSTQVVKIDALHLTVTTKSGRIYLLERPGFDADAEYIFTRWLVANGFVAVRDATSALLRLSNCLKQCSQ